MREVGIGELGSGDGGEPSSLGTSQKGIATVIFVDIYISISIVLLAWSLARSHEIDLRAIAIRRENCSL